MRSRISKKNVEFYLKQTYGFKSIEEFFERSGSNLLLKKQVLLSLAKEFNGLEVRDDKFVKKTPYQEQLEEVREVNFNLLLEEKSLLTELSQQHRACRELLRNHLDCELKQAKEVKIEGKSQEEHER